MRGVIPQSLLTMQCISRRFLHAHVVRTSVTLIDYPQTSKVHLSCQAVHVWSGTS